jgi:serine/threonine-protein kinase
MKTAFWKADWFFGLVIAIVVFGFSRASGFIPGLERWAYDLGVNMTSKTPSDKLAVIAIDDQSIANIGRWPWPREVQAKMIDQLAAAKAKVIGNTVFFFEPQKDPGLAYVEKMLDIYNKAYRAGAARSPGVAPIGGQTPARSPRSSIPPAQWARSARSWRGVGRAQQRRALAASMKKAEQRPGADALRRHLDPAAARQARQAAARLRRRQHDRRRHRRAASSSRARRRSIRSSRSAPSARHRAPELDGRRGRRRALRAAGDRLLRPAVPVAVAHARGEEPEPHLQGHQGELGESVSVCGKTIRTRRRGADVFLLYKDRDGPPRLPGRLLLRRLLGQDPGGQVPGQDRADRRHAAGIGANQVTPVSKQMHPVDTLAHSVSSILQEHFFVAPSWGRARHARHLHPGGALHHPAAAAAFGRHGRHRERHRLVALFGTHLGLIRAPGCGCN